MNSQNLISQSGWFWQNPQPTGNDLMEVKFADENTGYTVGWGSSVFKTTNSGLSWFSASELINFGITATRLSQIDVISANTVIISGNGFFKTTDGGNTWISLTTAISNIYDMDFINESTGYAVYNNTIYKTTNSGYNWQTTTLSGNWNCIYFLDLSTGYIGSTSGIIMITTDAGNNWSSISTGLNTAINSIKFINILTGFSAGGQKIYKTTNGGINWVTKVVPGQGSNAVISFVNPDTIYASTTGRVYVSRNSGDNWDSSSLCSSIKSLASPKGNLCITVGLGGTIFRTNNNGANWYSNSSFINCPGNFNVISFPDENNGYILGTGGMILKTTNTGMNWFSLKYSNNNFISAHFLNKDTGFAGTHRETVYFTSNGGINWDTTRYVNDSIQHIDGIYFQNYNTGFTSGEFSLYKTTNNGFNWFRVISNGCTNSNIQKINNSFFCSGNWQGMAGSRGMNIYKSTDTGQNWTLIYYWNNNWVNDFVMVDSLNGYFVYSSIYADYGIMKTTDGGYGWYNVFTSPFDGKSIYFPNLNTGYFSNGYKTTNGGINWFKQKLGYMDDYSYCFHDVFFINSNIGFTAGNYGMLIKTTDGGGILYPLGNINNYENNEANIFYLSQNYPNPFNPLTKIKFAIPVNFKGSVSMVKVAIFDILGKEVSVLINEELKPGTYETEWDGSNYSSGVYFYKLEAGDYIETKKMVLMK